MKLVLTPERLWTELDDDQRDDVLEWLADLGWLPTEVRTITVVDEGVVEIDQIMADPEDPSRYWIVDDDLVFRLATVRGCTPPPHLDLFEPAYPSGGPTDG